MSIRFSRIIILTCLFREYQQANRLIANPTNKDSSQNKINHSIRKILGYDPSEENNFTTESDCNSISDKKERESLNRIQNNNIFKENSRITSISSHDITESDRDSKNSNVVPLNLSTKRRKLECPYIKIVESEVQSFDSIKNYNTSAHIKSSDNDEFPLDLSVKKAKSIPANNVISKDYKSCYSSISEKYEGLCCLTDIETTNKSNAEINYDDLSVKELNTEGNMVESKNILLPFRFQKNCDVRDKIQGYDVENIKLINYLMNVQDEYAISFIFIINCVNINHKKLQYQSLSGCLIYSGFSEFIEISGKKYEKSLEQNDHANDFGKIYKEFEKFKKWIKTIYNIEGIEYKRNASRSYGCYEDFLNRIEPRNKTAIYKSHNTIIFSDNYKLLLQILPGLELFFLMEIEMKFKKDKAFLIRYLQLIILKFEIFRFRFFNIASNVDANLNTLHSNADFNEMVAILSVLSQRLYEIFKLYEYLEILEYLNFILFIRAKFSDIYEQYNLDQEYKNTQLFIRERSFIGTNNISGSQIYIPTNFKESKFFRIFANEKKWYYFMKLVSKKNKKYPFN